MLTKPARPPNLKTRMSKTTLMVRDSRTKTSKCPMVKANNLLRRKKTPMTMMKKRHRPPLNKKKEMMRRTMNKKKSKMSSLKHSH